ncbi:MAG: dihydroorotate oxidase catalytic subunit [Candidatus Saccharibacteria bacterium]|nr:dihydroorotate oxidase catalytic subunit [Candidatus Saccharibacteria bacterium]
MSEQYSIGHLEVASPWGNAGGVVKSPEDVELMAKTGVGWIEAGSYTLEPRTGNSPNGETVYYHDLETGLTYNSLGMPNKGFDVIEKQLPEMLRIAHAHSKPLLVNVAPVSEEPVMESRELIKRAVEAGVDGVILNAGCPNVVVEGGGRHAVLSHDPCTFGSVLFGVAPIVSRHDARLFVRTSPLEDYTLAQEIMARVIVSGAVSGVFAPNTWGGQKPQRPDGEYILEVPGNIGGVSGPGTIEDSRVQTQLLASILRSHHIDVISSSGITTGQELRTRLALGAVAGAGTTFFYESAEEGWSEATDRLLRQFSE